MTERDKKMANDDTSSSLAEAGKKKQREFNKSWRKERNRLKQQTNQLKKDIKGNPKIVNVVKNLESRIEILEDKLD